MPQIPPLMIKKDCGFANLYNEGQVLAETLGFLSFKFYVLLKKTSRNVLLVFLTASKSLI